MKKSIEKKLESLSTLGYKTTYATIDYGNGPHCAWCGKKNPSTLHLTIHDWVDKIKNIL